MNFTKTYFPFSLVEGGLPQGALIEVSGSTGGGKLEALMRFLSENPALQAAWVEEGCSTYPCAFPQYDVSLERMLFVNAETPLERGHSLLLDCAHQILRSQVFGVLVLLPRECGVLGEGGLGEVELRRLQIAAEKSGTTIVVVRETPSVEHTWPLRAQFQVSRLSPSFGEFRGELRVKILKYKSQPRECFPERFKDESVRSQALA